MKPYTLRCTSSIPMTFGFQGQQKQQKMNVKLYENTGHDDIADQTNCKHFLKKLPYKHEPHTLKQPIHS